jgi:hypothetical protein
MTDGTLATSDASHLGSDVLVAEVKTRIREHGLVVWLDAEGHYGPLMDTLATGALGFSYPIVSYHGSYLELMLAVEQYGNGLRPDHVLIHVPGVNKESVKETPVYELAAAGKMYERNLGTVVREAAVGVAKPEDVETFLRAPGLTLAKADAWLAELSAAPRDGMSLLLESLGLEEVVLSLLAGDRRLGAHLPKEGDKLLAFLEKGLGLDAAWRRFRLGEAELRPEAAAALVSSWLMAVEFVHDLKEPPVTVELRSLLSLGSRAKQSRKLAAAFRERLPDIYEELENDLQRVLAEERTSHHAEALGSIDTFRFEEATMRGASLDALRAGAWERAYGYSVDRTPATCFWVERSSALQRTWELIRLASEAGRAFAAQAKGLERCMSLEEATARYAEKLAPLDCAHRIFEQRAHALIASDLEDHDALLDVRATVRQAYRAWTNGVNRAFCDLCLAHGALPGRSLRQRAIYEDVVQRRLDEGMTTAFFMVDALRFEMAQDFARQLEREKYRVRLDARLAELPTETHVGMNALAPVEDGGKLHAVLKNGDLGGFRRKEFVVSDPGGRVRAIAERSSLGQLPLDLELEAFQDLSLTALKRKLVGKGSLVVVRSRELDTAGEHRLHLGTFDQTLALMKSAISLLSQAGIERFVVTSDHGFLLQDSTVDNVPFGASKRVPERRYAILDEPSGKPDVLEVRLSSLEYTAPKDLYLVFAPDTVVWKTRDDVAPFVHGGNSLQERVIPVLEIERAPRGRTTSKYEVVASPEPGHLGRQRLRVAVRLQNRETGTLAFEGPKKISLALRVPGRTELTLTVIAVEPPGELTNGRVLVPPNRGEAIIEFEIEGAVDDRVRVEVFHPDATADVTPKIVEGFFEVARDRRLRKPSDAPPAEAPVTVAPATISPAALRASNWEELVTDEAYRRVLQIVEERRSVNEEELRQLLGSPMRVRAFARSFDKLVVLLPFGIEVLTVNGMKVYARKD